MEAKRRHIQLAHSYWKNHVERGAWAIDATCGNGHDTQFLAGICEGVIAIDIQKEALENSLKQISAPHVHFYCQSHEDFPSLALEKPISLIVYNLGYLPGGEKGLTTLASSTLISLKRAMEILLPGGLISLTCYPGHPEGAIEEKALLSFAEGLDDKIWSVCHHRWLNRNRAPSLLLLQKLSV